MKQYTYFDYAATTPLSEKAQRAMEPYWSRELGNPGSLHLLGQHASAAVLRARRTIADAIGARYQEIVFTGSATEANNLALRGVVRGYTGGTLNPRIIVSAIEHESVLETARDLERDGAEIVTLPVSRDGIVSLSALQKALNNRTVLVSVMYANNEAGTIQPIAEIARTIRDFKKSSSPAVQQSGYPLFHTDAVQAFQYLSCDVDELGVDLLTLSGHKIYGPKGIGALFVCRTLYPIITGGGQEFGMRSGTENVPAIVGFGAAAEETARLRAREILRVTRLRDKIVRTLKKNVPHLAINGSLKERLPNNVNIYVPGRKIGELLMQFDQKGFALSAGPACSARTAAPSHVLRAMKFPEERCCNSMRITLGRMTDARSVDAFLKVAIQLFH